MSDFAGMEDLLQDFLQEASDLLSDVDNKLVDLEKMPDDRGLLNDIFRGFHTVKGGAGFLNAAELVTLCHLTENLFDRLRNGELELTPELMDIIMAATKGVRDMFGELGQMVLPQPADPQVIAALKGALSGEPPAAVAAPASGAGEPAVSAARAATVAPGEPDWNALHATLTGVPAAEAHGELITKAETETQQAAAAPLATTAGESVAAVAGQAGAPSPFGRRATDRPGGQPTTARRAEERGVRENTIRVDTSRLDQVLNLSGEIGLTKNRLTSLRADILAGKNDSETLHALDQAVSQLDLLVSDLQNSVMKTRMQPIGRLFQKYPRIARDLARQLGKDVELVLAGEETEVDKTMIEDLADPLIHLIRNAVDHGVESQEERTASGKPAKSVVRLEARQEGDHIVLIVADDGRG
ncbi:MAG TPA: Hpt domain-containing protein, partial [Azonexus sp.]|nr:Hpt domain-containing protein [Azonexus sp.]